MRSAVPGVLKSSLVLVVSLFGSVSFVLAEERRQEVEISHRHDSLDSGYSDWQAHSLDLQSRRPGEPSWYGALSSERRYGRRDESVELGVALPMDEDWVVQPEVGRGLANDFVADWYADLRLQRRLPQGFVGSTSLRRTQYPTSRVDRLALGLERYWVNWRGSYTLNLSDVQGGGTPTGHVLALDYYYDERSLIGLRGSLGREEEVLPGGNLITSDVQSIAVHGQHWFRPDWAISWELGSLSQGDLYDRHGIRLGLRHAF